MRFLSVCSGIEAASMAWKGLGWKAIAFSEIDPFACAALHHHYPDVPNWGDMTRFKEWPDASFDVLCGGTPCQSFSVAGLRKGLDDPRGNLMLTFGAIAGRYRPRWLVWENVPGVLSSNQGRDFGAFLGLLGLLGYGFAYRIFDAQYFGLAQRRKRVFVVGHLGNWRYPAAVLFERHSLQGHPAPSREKGEDIAGSLRGGAENGSPAHGKINGSDRMPMVSQPLLGHHYRNDLESGGAHIVFDTTQVTSDKNFSNPKPGDPCHPLAKGQHAPAIAFSNRGIESANFETLRAGSHGAIPMAAIGVDYTNGLQTEDLAGTLEAAQSKGNRGQGAMVGTHVRRLVPVECERLQGFPDNFTAIPYRDKPAADGPRYRALGNSWAVPCAKWIGERIQLLETLLKESP